MTVIVLGTYDMLQRVGKPPSHIQEMIKEIGTVYCPNCACARPVNCYRYRTWFTYCWIPCFPFRRGDYFLGCGECKEYLLDLDGQTGGMSVLLDSEAKSL